jgi:Fe-S-cluster containining protein
MDIKHMPMRTKREGCSCDECRECCRREPGWFAPAEVPIAAGFLGLSEGEFVEGYCECHDAQGAAALSPARKRAGGECVFFTADGLCGIHPVKPYECRKVYGCEGPSRHRRLRDIVGRMWR